MKNLKQFLDSLGEKIAQDMTKKEVIECLDIIATDMMAGESTLLHANTILSIRHCIMSRAEKKSDYEETDFWLSKIAAELGRKGGISKSEAKKKASAENGKKGGRPKKEK